MLTANKITGMVACCFITPEDSWNLLYGHGNRFWPLFKKMRRLDVFFNDENPPKPPTIQEVNPASPIWTLRDSRRGIFSNSSPVGDEEVASKFTKIWAGAVQEFNAAVAVGQIKAAVGDWGLLSANGLAMMGVRVPRRFWQPEYLVHRRTGEEGGLEVYSINFTPLFGVPTVLAFTAK